MNTTKLEDMTSAQLAEYYDSRAKKKYDDYQQTGERRFEREYIKLDMIADAFRAKAREEGEHEVDIKKRMANRDFAIGNLIPGKMYTKAEVEKLLHDAVWW